MRISDCAELTGTTVRTIRYYHQIGLLPTPDGRGRRDYGLDEVARILRIRWLAEAGLSLDAIADLLAEESAETAPSDGEPATLRDLQATADAIDTRIVELQTQRRRISHLLDLAEQGLPLTALPPGLAAFYDRLDGVTTDPHARTVLQRERHLAEMFAQRGLIPARAEALLARLTDDDLIWVAGYYSRFSRLARLDAAQADAETTALVDELDRWVRDNADLTIAFLELMPGWARRPRAIGALVDVSALAFPNAHQGDVLRRGVAGLIRVAQEKGAMA